MPRQQAEGVTRHLHDYLASERRAAMGDGELLGRFLAGDESAFAGLVRRHGPLVMGVCRRVLRHEQDAEDAFQATFLILARRAHSLGHDGSLAGYLHTVARRAALKTRAVRRPSALVEDPPAPAEDPDARELIGVLDEEIARLPEKYRTPLLLCDLQGMTHGQASRELGQPVGSMSRLVARGRELLRDRLAGRGFALPASGLAAALAGHARSGGWEAAWSCFGSEARVGEIVEAVLADMAWKPLRVASAVLLALGLLSGGLVAARPREDRPPAAAAPAAPVAGDDKRDESPLPPRALFRLGTSRFRHAYVGSAVAYSPDGKTLLTSSHLGTIRLWDAPTGKELRVLRGHNGGVTALAVSPDGKRAASGSWDASIRLWDLATGAQLRVIHGPGQGVCSLRFAPDGKTLASGSSDGVARLWEPVTGRPVRSITAHRGEARCVAFSADGKWLATAGADSMARLWDVATGTTVAVFKGHTAQVNEIAFSPEGKTLATCSHDQTLRLWDLEGKERHCVKQIGWLEGIAYAPDGKSVAVACGWGDCVRLWDVAGMKPALRWEGRQPTALRVAFRPDGKKLASTGWEATVRVWDAASGKEEGAVAAPGHTGWVYAVIPMPGGKTVVSAGSDRRILAWDRASGKLLREMKGHTDRVNALALSPDGRTIASGSRDKTVRLWDAQTGAPQGTFEPGGNVKSVTFSPDGRRLLTSSGRDLTDLWVQEVPGHNAAVWDVATRARLFRLEGHVDAINSAAFSPDGKTIVTGGYDRTVRVWDAGSGKELRQMPRTTGAVECVAFSPDGKLLAVCGQCVLQLYEVSSGAVVRVFPEAPNIYSVRLAFSPDGRTLLSAAGQYTDPLRLWDVATGQERARFVGHHGTAFGVAFSRDGRVLISGGSDAAVLLWDVTGRAYGGKLAFVDLSPAELKAAWDDVSSDVGAKAHRAVWALVASKQAVAMLRERLKPVMTTDLKRLGQLIQELDDDGFATREKAGEEIEKLGEAAVPVLKKTLEAGPSAEVRVRIRRLLNVLEGQAARNQALLHARGVEVLEHIGTKEARRLLESLADGAAGAPLTREAKSALDRLTTRGFGN